MIRITSSGPGSLLGAAGIPVPAHDANAWQGRGLISGSPGTAHIPAPAPGAVPQSWNRALHRSSDGPSWWRPSVYYLHGPQVAPPISVSSDNQMPVPAVDPRGKPAVMSFRPHFLGQTQIVQPAALPRWRNRASRGR